MLVCPKCGATHWIIDGSGGDFISCVNLNPPCTWYGKHSDLIDDFRFEIKKAINNDVI